VSGVLSRRSTECAQLAALAERLQAAVAAVFSDRVDF
jgi:hypothetical protein